MIQLHNHSLVFETADGDLIPCDAEEITIELIGDAVKTLDPNLVRQAATAVLHYFKQEIHQEIVTVNEFTFALQSVLRSLGLEIVDEESQPQTASQQNRKILEADLGDLIEEDGSATELIFFKRLQREFGKLLNQSPRLVRLTGLRRAVKNLVGAQRWSKRCDATSDQIVCYLRDCMGQREQGDDCALMIH